MRSNEEKYQTVIEKNTFYFFDPEFDESNEVENIDTISNLLHNLYEQIQQNGVKKVYFEDLLLRPNGLTAILALNGFSQESLKRVITFARVVDDPELNFMLNRQNWQENDTQQGDLSEWSTQKITRLIRTNDSFRKGIVNLFFEGASNRTLARALRPFERKKLSIRKLKFDTDEMIDTLVRYKQKGSVQATGKNNAENLIRSVLDQLNIEYESGDLPLLLLEKSGKKRTIDFVIPGKKNPQILIECSFQVTTSSNLGDKSKTEIGNRDLIQQYYPNALFWGFVDGIGWYVRKNDLNRMVSAYDEVFTFHEEELARFRQMLTEVFGS